MKPIRLLAILEAAAVTGPAKNLFQFAEYAQSGNWGPAVEVGIAVFERGDAPNLVGDAARASSIQVYPIHERARFDRAVIAPLRAAIEDFHPDILQTHSVKSHFLTRFAGLHRLAPWVAFHHGYTWPDLRMRLYNQLDRWSLRSARRVITVSRSFLLELIRAGVDPARIDVVHNAIEPEWGREEQSEHARSRWRSMLGIAPDEQVVVAVGRLSREKDHATLIRAFRRLTRNGARQARLVIVGDGPEKNNILQMVKALGITGDLLLAGHAANVAPYYAIADAVALSSRSEGSPNALLEAMAAGVPVAATAVGGVPEMVRHLESAILVEPGDAEALASALSMLLEDGDLRRRLAARARERVTDYAPDRRTRRLAETYARILGLDAGSETILRGRAGPLSTHSPGSLARGS